MSEHKVEVNSREIKINIQDASVFLNGKPLDIDLVEFRKGHFHILDNHASYTAEVIAHNIEEKTFSIKVNSNIYNLTVSDSYDVLLRAMGMDKPSHKKVNNVIAPMPGLVLKVMVEAGQAINKGDAMLVLEAMKMENILKAPADGVVRKILVHKGDKVEKNQVMLNMGE